MTPNKKKDNAAEKPKSSPARKSIPVLPAVLVAIISTAVFIIFAPGVTSAAYNVFLAPFSTREVGPVSAGAVPFDVVEIPGRGKGVIANRDIKQGERLITERPLFVVPTKPGEDPSLLIKRRVRELSPAEQNSFYALSHAKPNITPDRIPFEIFQTNAISAGSRGTGLFPRTARLNHGCSKAFSAVYSWRDDEGVLVVHAIRDIPKGQEILTTYTNTKRRRSDRQAYLKEVYHFDCACAVCALNETESAASDKRLLQMVDAYSMFSMWGSDAIKGSEAIKIARRIWTIGDAEGYISERGQLAADAAHVAAAHGDKKAAKQWAYLAHKWYGIELGLDSQPSRNILAIMNSPESHPAWDTRDPERVGGTGGLS